MFISVKVVGVDVVLFWAKVTLVSETVLIATVVVDVEVSIVLFESKITLVGGMVLLSSVKVVGVEVTGVLFWAIVMLVVSTL